jgi:hypothetical protein
MLGRRILVCLCLLAALGACSGDDGLSDAEQAFADKWAETLRDDEDGLSADRDEAQCMGEAIMAELGTDPFDNAEVRVTDIAADEEHNSPGELVGDKVITDEQADAILDVWEEKCADLAEVLAESASGEFELDDEGAGCFVDGLREGTLTRDLLRPAFTDVDDTPDAATLTTMLALLDSCGGEGAAGAIVTSIAGELSADGTMTEAQGQCVAEALVEDLGLERIIEVTTEGDFEDADPAYQEEFASALLTAASGCGVPLSAFGG